MTSGIALAGMALAPSVVGAAQPAPRDSSRKIRIGVVGGGFGCAFYWHQDPNCSVVAVSDLRPERRESLKQVYGCDKAYDSLEELIKDKNVEAVAVFTGAPDHVRHSIACLNAGKHVISAVPAAMNMEEAKDLLEAVEKTGLTYMMAETSYYGQSTISVRDMYKQGKFGEIFYSEAQYHHAGLEVLYFENDKRTWRHGLPPMLYPTHCTAFLIGVTGERLVEVSCVGWGDDSPICKDNAYKNPFWNETAMFKTDKGHGFKVEVFWKGAHRGCERGLWYGDKMSFFMPDPNGLGPIIVRSGGQTEKDSAGFVRQLSEYEVYDQPQFYASHMLPEAMRHTGGHDGAEPFLTHEFIDALVNERRPTVDIYEALAYTVPGIVAHESALHGGKQMKVPVFDRKG